MKATDKQLEYLRDLMEKYGYSEEDVRDYYDVDSLEELSIEQASSVIDDLKVLGR